MNGKHKCKILKDIRRQIAAENDIEYVTTDCQFQGECKGTCPKCEAEVRYLETELHKRRRAGKAVAVAGVAAAVLMTATGCTGTVAPTSQTEPSAASAATALMGDMPLTTTTAPEEEVVLKGDVPYEEELMDGEIEAPVEDDLLMGDVPVDESC